MMILGVIALFVAAGLSLVVACMSIAIRVLSKRIVRRYGGYVMEPVDTEREENARKWIDRLLWITAILGFVIALTNIGVAILRLVDRCPKG
jgi:ABC-type Fe3+ transport system permease subunit